MIKFKDLLNYQLSTDTIGYSKAAASKKKLQYTLLILQPVLFEMRA